MFSPVPAPRNSDFNAHPYPLLDWGVFLESPETFRKTQFSLYHLQNERVPCQSRYFAVILIFIPFTTYEKTSSTE